jgi:biotin synthase
MNMHVPNTDLRFDWTNAEISALFDLPFMELVYRAASIHRAHFNPSELQLSQLLSIKTGGCAENCGYCSQSAHFDTGLKASKLMATAEVLTAAKAAKASGAQRFCMGAAWRDLKDRDVPALSEMISGVKALGLETCATLGMLSAPQALALKTAGLDYYNHNLDTSKDFYDQVVTTRTYAERLETLGHVRASGLKTCCGGILGMGETRSDRVAFLQQLATLPSHPESIPINNLVAVKGTPIGDKGGDNGISGIEFIRTIAVTRIICPKSMVRLSAGRTEMSEELQALCVLAGANSIFVGEQLLTTPNPKRGTDAHLFRSLGLRPMGIEGP